VSSVLTCSLIANIINEVSTLLGNTWRKRGAGATSYTEAEKSELLPKIIRKITSARTWRGEYRLGNDIGVSYPKKSKAG
jgi:hypothetical protein